MKFILRLIFILFFLPLAAKPLNLSVAADSAILINADTGAILYEKQSKKLQFPASITKIATVLYALKFYEGQDFDKAITADFDSVSCLKEDEMRKANYNPPYRLVHGGTHMGIKKGEVLSRNDLLYGTMLISANDGANLIAKDVGGTVSEFMLGVNEYLTSIGCKDTKFKNPHGLYHPEHVTTARDMAELARDALKNPQFREIVKTVRYMRPKTNMQEPTPMVNFNKLLRQGKFYYPKTIGVKTGHLSISKNTFVAAAESEGRTLIVVLLKTEERDDIFRDAKLLFETAFSEKKVRRKLLSAGPQKSSLTLKGVLQPIKTCLKDDIFIEYYPSEEPNIQCVLEWNKVSTPILKDQEVGQLVFKDSNGITLFTHSLLASEDVTGSLASSIVNWIKNHPFLMVIICGIFVVIVWRFLVSR
jgi:serine-type D-Ala-D-Ala carboxypeptidase (penicillin-binding protein 5/6)